MRLLKPVDNKFKVHLIINYSSEREFQLGKEIKYLGSISLGAISSGRLKSDRSAELSRVTGSNLDPKALVCAKKSYCEIRLKRKLRVTRPGTHVSRFSFLVYKKAKICDMLLSVYCVYDASLKFTLTPDTHACSDLKFFPT